MAKTDFTFRLSTKFELTLHKSTLWSLDERVVKININNVRAGEKYKAEE